MGAIAAAGVRELMQAGTKASEAAMWSAIPIAGREAEPSGR